MTTKNLALKWREIRELLALNLKVKLRNCCDYLHTLYRHYRNFSFAKVDLLLLSQYLFKSPFRYCKEHFQATGEMDPYTYGETPIGTLAKIAQEAKITASDSLLELGCGRARSCFWFNKIIGCNVTGVDVVPTFIRKANWVKEMCAVEGVEFHSESILETDLTVANVLYLYGTCYSEEFLKEFVERCTSLPSGARIVTVSYPLTEYASESLFEVMKVFPASYTWGEADVYLQYKR